MCWEGRGGLEGGARGQTGVTGGMEGYLKQGGVEDTRGPAGVRQGSGRGSDTSCRAAGPDGLRGRAVAAGRLGRVLLLQVLHLCVCVCVCLFRKNAYLGSPSHVCVR